MDSFSSASWRDTEWLASRFCQRGLHAAFFVGAEPAGVGNPVVQQEEHGGAQGHGRQSQKGGGQQAGEGAHQQVQIESNLPGLGNLFMILMKDTALVSVIGLEEIMRQAQNAVTFAKHPFTFYMVAAVMYLGLTILAMGTMHVLEKRAARGFVRRT